MSPAPDLPPPIVHGSFGRTVSVSLTPGLADEDEIRGAVVVVVDAIRASVTIAAALHAGASRVIPVLTVEDAFARAATYPEGQRPVLGGERGGRHIPGFDLGNSPIQCTADLLRGRDLVFTTTNGTAALLFAAQAGAAEIIVGSFANLSVVCERLLDDPRPVHILCAGTRDKVTLDDCLVAGAMVDTLLASQDGQNPRLLSGGDGGDPARLCLAAWHLAQAGGDLTGAMLASRGGRNLAAIGLESDVADCSSIDSHPVHPRFDPTTGSITRA